MRIEIIPLLFEKYLTYHTRRGLRLWCNCEYCTAKISGTRYIAHNTFYAHGSNHYRPASWPSCIISDRKKLLDEMIYARSYDYGVHDSYEDYIVRGIEFERERKRRKLRAELQELKEKIL